jgi:triosephosphate isomerase
MKIIAANWKMNNAFDETDAWLESFFTNFAAYRKEGKKFDDVEMVLCPPTFIIDYVDGEFIDDGFSQLAEILKNENKQLEDLSPEEINEVVLNRRPVQLGAQDCHHELNGSFTGNISASMLNKIGCKYVIVGHSERREQCIETNEMIAKKAATAFNQGLTPIICVGEDKATRNQGKHLHFLYKQVMESIPQNMKFKKLVIAYEPIWSIGTGVTPSMKEIAEAAKLIKQIVNEKFPGAAEEFFMLYGGSVTSENSKEILSVPGVDGLLVGKASLDAEEFLKICSF